MKKIMTLFFVCAFFALSISAFAAEETGWVAEVDENIDFRPSKDVEVYYDIDAAATSSQVYVIGTKHGGGDAVFGSSSGDSTIYKDQDDTYKGKSGGETGVTFPTAGASDWSTDWEAI
jgi:hypothetical protein